MADKKYYKVPMHDGNGFVCLFPFVIIECDDEDCSDPYDLALGELPHGMGDATDDGEYDLPPIEEITNPLEQPWPIFTVAYFKQCWADRLANRR